MTRTLTLTGLLGAAVVFAGCTIQIDGDYFRKFPGAAGTEDQGYADVGGSNTSHRRTFETRPRDPEQEERYLLVLTAEELQILRDTIIADGAYSADPDARIKFDWERLDMEIRFIVDGIRLHLDGYRPGPGGLPDISGKYSD